MGAVTRAARSGAAIFAAFFALIQLTPLTPWIVRHMAMWDEPPKSGGVMIVLGAEQNMDRTLGVMSYWRCIYAVRAWRTGNYSKIVVSGGGNPPLAVSMGEFLQAMGVPKEDLLLEPDSTSTHFNAIHSAPILRTLPGPYTLVTSDFHILRAQRCFRRAGIAVNSQPTPDILKRSNDWRQRWHCTIILAEEWCKLAYYWWQDWI